MMLEPEGRKQNREFGRASAGSCEEMSWTILLPSPGSLWLVPFTITRSLGVTVSISLRAISAGSGTRRSRPCRLRGNRLARPAGEIALIPPNRGNAA